MDKKTRLQLRELAVNGDVSALIVNGVILCDKCKGLGLLLTRQSFERFLCRKCEGEGFISFFVGIRDQINGGDT